MMQFARALFTPAEGKATIASKMQQIEARAMTSESFCILLRVPLSARPSIRESSTSIPARNACTQPPLAERRACGCGEQHIPYEAAKEEEEALQLHARVYLQRQIKLISIYIFESAATMRRWGERDGR